MSIMPATRRHTTTEPDLTAVVLVLALTEPDLHTPAPDETPDELAAREAAAADITDDILFELMGSAA
ncbi:hypothetical protein [Nocardiopsis sp. YSL2]|uniref:hypothetical protein n=1 Tax=Nocardiopsis sp. YSL2 TaxID=2939492 RepID=UPI0026F46B66|nr:hypothetical protein [Nocardiopsis sp. YSL2]